MDVHVLSLLRNTTGTDRESLLALVKEYDMKRKMHTTTRVPVRTSSGDTVMIPEFLVLTSRVLETQDFIEDCEDLRKALTLISNAIPNYGIHTYVLYDLLGCDFELNVPSFKHLPRWVVTTDGYRIPLPRIIDYSSSVLNDDELLKITEMPVPFTKSEIDNTICLVFNAPCVCKVSELALIDFLGCDTVLDKFKGKARLTRYEWLSVLQMRASFAQKLSGWTLTKNKLSSSEGTITLEDDKYVVALAERSKDDSLIKALNDTGLKLVWKANWHIVDLCDLKPNFVYDFGRSILRTMGTVVDDCYIQVAMDFAPPLRCMMTNGENNFWCTVTIDADGYKFEQVSSKTSSLKLCPTAKWYGEEDVDVTMIYATLSKDEVKTGHTFFAKVNM